MISSIVFLAILRAISLAGVVPRASASDATMAGKGRDRLAKQAAVDDRTLMPAGMLPERHRKMAAPDTAE